jgi:hypothetical protein
MIARTYYSKCTNTDCGWIFRHERPLRELTMLGRLCGQCGDVLIPVTEDEWNLTSAAPPAAGVNRRET